MSAASPAQEAPPQAGGLLLRDELEERRRDLLCGPAWQARAAAVEPGHRLYLTMTGQVASAEWAVLRSAEVGGQGAPERQLPRDHFAWLTPATTPADPVMQAGVGRT